MKPAFGNKITADDFPKVGEPFSRKFVQNFAAMVTQLATFFANGITFADNMATAWVKNQTFVHGVAVAFANPLASKSAPFQVQVLPRLATDAKAISSYTAAYLPATNQVQVTVNYVAGGSTSDTPSVLVIGG